MENIHLKNPLSDFEIDRLNVKDLKCFLPLRGKEQSGLKEALRVRTKLFKNSSCHPGSRQENQQKTSLELLLDAEELAWIKITELHKSSVPISSGQSGA